MSSLGKSGPKARLGSVADGQQVEIPVPRGIRNVGTRAQEACRERKDRCKRSCCAGGKTPVHGGSGVKRSKHKGSEVPGVPAEKSRYCVPRARTVNRHRWMGRESQGRRKKYCQGTRQNGPVTSGEGTPGVKTGPQRTGPGNCLAKTQVYAKPQGEVYGLTPARCWKVKGRGQGEEIHPKL